MNTHDTGTTAMDTAVEREATIHLNVYGQGSSVAHRDRHARALRHSEYQPTEVYVRDGDRLEILASGSVLENLFAVIGVPELDTPVTIPLTFGNNIIEATSSGLLSFINQSVSGTCYVVVRLVVARVPRFTLGLSTNAGFVLQMIAYPAAPVVLLTSSRAIIVVRYRSAQLYLNDPLTLMRNFDRFIAIQDDISGVGDWALEQCRVDPNKLLYVETDSGYMQATQGHMSFNGAYPLTALLSTDPEHGWGPWHESGHQRQVGPMTWWVGTGMSEVMVNLYAMAVQEVLEGRASRLDGVYPATKIYLQQLFRDYNAIGDAFEKLVMLWQLRLTFGTTFYPQLHQCYRLMQDIPATEVDKAQRFMTETSLLAGIDLTPFYDRWGLYATMATVRRLEHLPALDQPLWETDVTHTFPLPIPQPSYIPVLAYLQANISLPSVSGTSFLLFINSQWLRPYRYEISVNGRVIASVDNGIGEHCVISGGDTVAHVTVPVGLGPKDKVEVHAVLDGNRHRVLVGSRSHAGLVSRISSLFTDSEHTVLEPSATQADISQLFRDLDPAVEDASLFESLQRAQKLLLAKTVSFVEISDALIIVYFTGEAFRGYDYKLITAVRTLASLQHGTPLFSTLIGNVWSWRGLYDHGYDIHVIVTMEGGREYTLLSSSLAQDAALKPVRSLFTDDSLTALIPTVGHSAIDSLRRNISGTFALSPFNRALALGYLSTAQTLVYRRPIDRIDTVASFDVYFANDQLKNERYYFYVDGLYASELLDGHPAYSSLTGRHWRTDVNVGNLRTWTLYTVHEGVMYPIFSSAAGRSAVTAPGDVQPGAITCCGEGVNAPCGAGEAKGKA